MDYDQIWLIECNRRLANGEITATLMRRGAIVSGWPSRYPCLSKSPTHKRGIIQSATVRSLIRGAYAVSNAPCDLDLMTTLTFREAPGEAKAALRRFCVSMRLAGILGRYWGWWQEYQERGVIHYHLLHCASDLEEAQQPLLVEWRPVLRRGVKRWVASGLAEEAIVEMWLEATQDASPASRRYNYGGITEVVANPGGISSYLGNYMRKMSQKTLPPGETPQGRWWWLSPECEPIMGETIIVDHWPYKRPHRLVYDHRSLLNDLDQTHVKP